MHDLIIDLRDGGDWSLDLCFAGLVHNHGPQHVIDFPNKSKHREWAYKRNQSDWGLERRTLGHTEFNRDVPRFSEFDVIEAGRAGLIDRIWLDERMESFAQYRRLGLDSTSAKVVVVAGHDRFWNQTPKFVADLYGDRLEAMLLDNWYPEYAKLPFRTRRIGWSCNFDHYWSRPETPPEKDIDISFVGYNSHPDRARFVDHIEKRWPDLKKHIVLEREPNSFGKFVPKAEYFNIIQRSKIALNLKGAADRGKTMRAYEIPYVGSFMLSQVIGDPGMTDDFVAGEHCMYFANEDQLDVLIEHFLSADERREQIAAQGHTRAIGPLSVKQRWADVIKLLDDGRPVQDTVR